MEILGFMAQEFLHDDGKYKRATRTHTRTRMPGRPFVSIVSSAFSLRDSPFATFGPRRTLSRVAAQGRRTLVGELMDGATYSISSQYPCYYIFWFAKCWAAGKRKASKPTCVESACINLDSRGNLSTFNGFYFVSL